MLQWHKEMEFESKLKLPFLSRAGNFCAALWIRMFEMWVRWSQRLRAEIHRHSIKTIPQNKFHYSRKNTLSL